MSRDLIKAKERNIQCSQVSCSQIVNENQFQIKKHNNHTTHKLPNLLVTQFVRFTFYINMYWEEEVIGCNRWVKEFYITLGYSFKDYTDKTYRNRRNFFYV